MGIQVAIHNLLVPALQPCIECPDKAVRQAVAHLYFTISKQTNVSACEVEVLQAPELIADVITLSYDEDISVCMLATVSILVLLTRSTSSIEKNKVRLDETYRFWCALKMIII